MGDRYLIIAENPGFAPSQRAQLLRDLRGILPALNVRIASRHLEILVRGIDAEEARRKIEGAVGRVYAVIDVTDEDSLGSGDIGRFVELFNSERFWEAHAEIEPAWRRSGDRALQGLILMSAAFVKLQEGAPDKFVLLAQEALELLEGAPQRIGCIDVPKLREQLAKSLVSRSPFAIACS
jgi:predicted metal-dependent hydrolase